MNNTMTGTDQRRLHKWQAHLATRGIHVPDEADFLSFGRLSTLERLRNVLCIVAPDHCGPLATAISRLKREKLVRRSLQPDGQRRPGRDCTCSVEKEALPQDWRDTLNDMRRRRAAIDAGMIDFGAIVPPAPSQISAIEYVLRCIAKVCADAGRSVDVDIESVALWRARQEAAEQAETGLSLQLRKLADFLRYRQAKKNLARKIRAEAARYARIGRLKRKRKHSWLLANPTDIGKVWCLAEDLLAQSRAAKAGTSRRYLLALHASALALAVAAPLRISDLWRLRFDAEIRRDATGWAISIRTQKTGADYECSALWPELTEFLDELLILDAPGGDLWLGYERRAGTPLFSRDGGVTALSADWISDVWYEHVGTGEHIVRTLWHQLAYDSDIDRTWLALALCGQKGGGRTAGEYRETNRRARAVRAGRSSLASIRQTAKRNHSISET